MALAALLALGPIGCTATLALDPASPAARQANTTDTVDGEELPAIEGRILESDRDQLMVERCHDGQPIPLSRESVRDIDHPGNVVALLGVGLTVVGIALLTVSFFGPGCSGSYSYTDPPPDSCGEDFGELRPPAVVALVLGGATSLTGLVIWKISKAAARQ